MNKCNSSDVRRFQCSLSGLFLNIHTSLLLRNRIIRHLRPGDHNLDVMWNRNYIRIALQQLQVAALNGKQYVAVVSGRTQSIPAFLGEIGEKMVNASPEGGTLFVFALN